ncbi:hypothetical protein [Lysobacter gummosus]|uniref:hypothetical protein n=1 Tax=Lysobacter gummosus TaxID=262324 RepID=UPI003634C898
MLRKLVRSSAGQPGNWACQPIHGLKEATHTARIAMIPATARASHPIDRIVVPRSMGWRPTHQIRNMVSGIHRTALAISVRSR